MDLLVIRITWLFALIVDTATSEKQVEGGFLDFSFILLDWGAYHEWIDDFVRLEQPSAHVYVEILSDFVDQLSDKAIDVSWINWL